MTEHGLWQPDTPATQTTQTIWKYGLAITDEQTIQVPVGATALSVQNQNGVLCLWVQVHPDFQKVSRTVYVYGTGNPIPNRPRQEYLGTVQWGGRHNPLVWHVYWEPEALV